MIINRDELKLKTVKQLKIDAKMLGLQGYSKFKKDEVIKNIIEFRAATIIQRRVRNKISKNELCPFSMEPINYPCFGKKVGNVFFYCNLVDLANFLVSSGDFREPNTRTYYTKNELYIIEDLVKFYKIKLPRSISNSIENKRFYIKQKCNEEQIDILIERIRFTCWMIVENVEEIFFGRETLDNVFIKLENIYFPELSACMVLLYQRSIRDLQNSIISSKIIIDNIKFDCFFIEKIKNHFYSWLISEKTKFGLESLEL